MSRVSKLVQPFTEVWSLMCICNSYMLERSFA